MVNLKNLTVPLLEKLANELGIKLNKKARKPEKIRQIKNADIDSKKLEDLYNKYIASKSGKIKVSPSKAKKAAPLKIKKAAPSKTKLEERVMLLEEQVRFLITKIDNIEGQITKQRNQDRSPPLGDIKTIKRTITSLISPGDSMTIDELRTKGKFKKYSWKLLEKAIIDLIDDEIFDGAEGKSKNKVERKIGRIIRR